MVLYPQGVFVQKPPGPCCGLTRSYSLIEPVPKDLSLHIFISHPARIYIYTLYVITNSRPDRLVWYDNANGQYPLSKTKSEKSEFCLWPVTESISAAHSAESVGSSSSGSTSHMSSPPPWLASRSTIRKLWSTIQADIHEHTCAALTTSDITNLNSFKEPNWPFKIPLQCSEATLSLAIALLKWCCAGERPPVLERLKVGTMCSVDA